MPPAPRIRGAGGAPHSAATRADFAASGASWSSQR
jgi:hypothetical protein